MSYDAHDLVELFSDLKEVIQYSEKPVVPESGSASFFIGTQMDFKKGKTEGFWFTMTYDTLTSVSNYLRSFGSNPTNLEIVQWCLDMNEREEDSFRFFCTKGSQAISIVS